MRTAVVLAALVLASLILAQSRDTDFQFSKDLPLPKIAPAPDFTLTSQDGTLVSLAYLRGKVVAITFIYTLCTDTCPVLHPMISFVEGRVRPDLGNKVAFVSITVDPE